MMRDAERQPTGGLDTAAMERAFVAELRRKRRAGLVSLISLNLLGIVLFLLAWEVLPRVVPNVNILMFPPPSSVVDALLPLVVSGELASHILISLQRAMAGFALATVLGIAAGLFTARIRVLQHITESRAAGFPIHPGDCAGAAVAHLVRHR